MRVKNAPERTSAVRANRCDGMSLLELVILIAVIGILVGASALYLRPMEAPLRTGAELFEGMIKQTRAKAAATTTVHRVRPATDNRIVVEFANSCSAGSWTADPDLGLDLPDEVTLTNTSWTICFGSRGMATASQTLTLTHPHNGSQQLEVLMGGSVRWL